MRQLLKKIIIKSSFLEFCLNFIKCIVGKVSFVRISPIYFDGWKMATGTRPPWLGGGGHNLSRGFVRVDAELKQLVKDGKVLLTQFNQKNVESELDGLSWRHYLVYWSAVYSIQNTKSGEKSFAEFGVCDGLTSYYAISAAKDLKVSFSAYLYDAWDAMKNDLLMDSEKKSVGSYSYLNIENTKNNLSYLNSSQLIFNKGYIPEVFESAENPNQLSWLHIDLNSAIPTVFVLERFWDLIEVGGLVLLDDFAWPGYEDTQIEVEKWAHNKNCNILQFPTGQAILFKLD